MRHLIDAYTMIDTYIMIDTPDRNIHYD
jgi:hypothetical protein